MERFNGMKAMLLAARFAIFAGIIVGIVGAARVIGDGLETGSWQPAWILGWVVLGAMPYVGGTLTGRAMRGPGHQGLVTVALVTTLLGVAAVTIWVLDGMSRR